MDVLKIILYCDTDLCNIEIQSSQATSIQAIASTPSTTTSIQEIKSISLPNATNTSRTYPTLVINPNEFESNGSNVANYTKTQIISLTIVIVASMFIGFVIIFIFIAKLCRKVNTIYSQNEIIIVISTYIYQNLDSNQCKPGHLGKKGKKSKQCDQSTQCDQGR